MTLDKTLICIYPASCPLYPHLWSPQVVMLECPCYLYLCTSLIPITSSQFQLTRIQHFWSYKTNLKHYLLQKIIANKWPDWFGYSWAWGRTMFFSRAHPPCSPHFHYWPCNLQVSLPCSKIPICHSLTFLFLDFLLKSNMEDKNESSLHNFNISSITPPRACAASSLSHGSSQDLGALFYVYHHVGA